MERLHSTRNLWVPLFLSAALACHIVCASGCQPRIDRLVPDKAAVEESIEIQGKGFGSVQGRSVVTLGGNRVEDIDRWSEESITVRIPPDARTSDVQVIVNAIPSNPAPFTLAFDGFQGGCMELRAMVEDTCFPDWHIDSILSVLPYSPMYMPGYDELPLEVHYDLPYGIGTLSFTAILGNDGRLVAEAPVRTFFSLDFVMYDCLVWGSLDGWAVPTSPTTANAEITMTEVETVELIHGGCHDFSPISDECSLTFRIEGLRKSDECI